MTKMTEEQANRVAAAKAKYTKAKQELDIMLGKTPGKVNVELPTVTPGRITIHVDVGDREKAS